MHSVRVTDLKELRLMAWAVASMCCLKVMLVLGSAIANLKGVHACIMGGLE